MRHHEASTGSERKLKSRDSDRSDARTAAPTPRERPRIPFGSRRRFRCRLDPESNRHRRTTPLQAGRVWRDGIQTGSSYPNLRGIGRTLASPWIRSKGRVCDRTAGADMPSMCPPLRPLRTDSRRLIRGSWTWISSTRRAGLEASPGPRSDLSLGLALGTS
jgi:hypothetical protein